jgi:hypothetical protein
VAFLHVDPPERIDCPHLALMGAEPAGIAAFGPLPQSVEKRIPARDGKPGAERAHVLAVELVIKCRDQQQETGVENERPAAHEMELYRGLEGFDFGVAFGKV